MRNVPAILALLLPLSLSAQSAPTFTAATDRLERAVLDDDLPTMKATRLDLLKLLTTAPAAGQAAIRYAVAYADWRQSTSPAVPKNTQDQLLDEAESQLQTVLKGDPASAEAAALLSSVYGLKIAHSPIKGMFLGSKSSGAIARAAKLEPRNPRVLLAQGVGKFNAPGMFGGSVKEAERLLRAAIEQFEAESPTKAFPAWGRFDAHAWLGQVLAKKGDKAGARTEYAKALEIAPQSGWVRFVLLPALDK